MKIFTKKHLSKEWQAAQFKDIFNNLGDCQPFTKEGKERLPLWGINKTPNSRDNQQLYPVNYLLLELDLPKPIKTAIKKGDQVKAKEWTEKFKDWYQQFKQDQNLKYYLMYLTPSTRGIRFMLKLDRAVQNEQEYKQAVLAFLELVKSYGIDESFHDYRFNQAWFVPTFREFYHLKEQIFTFVPQPKIDTKQTTIEEQAKPVKFAPSNSPQIMLKDYSYQQKELDNIILFLKNKGLSITVKYENWFKVGFALIDTFPKHLARHYFLELSKMDEAVFNEQKVNEQFNTLLNRYQPDKISFGSIIAFARKKGYQQESKEPVDNPYEKNLPTIPQKFYDNLPPFLKDCCNKFDITIERDFFLLGALTIISGCMPNIKGYYKNRKIGANLFSFILANASAGKSTLLYSYYLGDAIHKHRKELYEAEKLTYESALSNYQAQSKGDKELTEKPEKPKSRLLYIPANNSNTGVCEMLSNNPLGSIMFCTEADTMSNTSKQEWGNYSDVLRASFEHEPIRYNRRTNEEFIELETSFLSVLLSGTPKQLFKLINDAENGLLSRFIYYKVDQKPKMANVFKRSKGAIDLEDYFKLKGDNLLKYYKVLEGAQEPVLFTFTTEQEINFMERADAMHDQFFETHGDESMSIIRRLLAIAFKIAMILTYLRNFISDKQVNENELLICSDIDYQNALILFDVLIEHSANVLESYKGKAVENLSHNKQRLFDALPDTFYTKDSIKLAQQYEMNERTLFRFLGDRSLFIKLKKGQYSKASIH